MKAAPDRVREIFSEEVLSDASNFLRIARKLEATFNSLPQGCRRRFERVVGLVRAYAAAVEEIEDKVRLGEELDDWDRIMLAGLPIAWDAAEAALAEVKRSWDLCA